MFSGLVWATSVITSLVFHAHTALYITKLEIKRTEITIHRIIPSVSHMQATCG